MSVRARVLPLLCCPAVSCSLAVSFPVVSAIPCCDSARGNAGSSIGGCGGFTNHYETAALSASTTTNIAARLCAYFAMVYNRSIYTWRDESNDRHSWRFGSGWTEGEDGLSLIVVAGTKAEVGYSISDKHNGHQPSFLVHGGAGLTEQVRINVKFVPPIPTLWRRACMTMLACYTILPSLWQSLPDFSALSS